MTRNLERRIELMFPILQANHQQRIYEILQLSITDNTNRRIQLSDGTYQLVVPNQNDPIINSQDIFQQLAENQ